MDRKNGRENLLRGVHKVTNGKRDSLVNRSEHKNEDNSRSRSIIRIYAVKEYITPIKIDISDD